MCGFMLFDGFRIVLFFVEMIEVGKLNEGNNYMYK